MVIERVPSIEMVRFVNSGTEACLSVLRLMRAYTGREKARPLPTVFSLNAAALTVECLCHRTCMAFSSLHAWTHKLTNCQRHGCKAGFACVASICGQSRHLLSFDPT